MTVRLLFVFALALLGVAPATAQTADLTADQAAAYKVVSDLFDAMRSRNTAAMRAAFVPNASMQSITPDSVQIESVDGWIIGIGGAPAGLVLDERLANAVVQVDANLATVWVDYWFFAGDRFSHCGVDAFKLARHRGVWRVFSVVDTRRREGCPPAPAKKS